MTNKQLTITAIISFILFVFALIPAKIAYSLAPTIDGLEMSLIEGSLWNGSAENIRYNGVDFGNSHWSISPFSIFLLSLSGDLHSKSNDSQIDANFNLSMNSFESDSIKARFPAQWLPLLTQSKFKTEGNVLVRLLDFKQSQQAPLKIVGTVAWQQATLKTAFGAKATLGDLQINISSEQQHLLFNLHDNQGSLGLDAKIKFTPPNKIIARGSVNENLPIELANFFKFFAKPNQKGKLVFDYNGIIPGL